MLPKLRNATFLFCFLSVSQTVLGRPLGSETQHKPAVVRAHVVRAHVVPREASSSCTSCATRVTVTVSGTATASAAFTVTVGSPTSTPTANAIGNFGSCSIPQIEFGTGFDGRTETSFQPVDKVSYRHNSSDIIGTITDFMCNALVNTCNADATAQATCAKAQAAAAAEIPREGIDADAFNVVFGIQTNFKNVEAVNNTSDPIVSSASSAATDIPPASSTTTSPTSAAPPVSSDTGVPLPTASSSASSDTSTTESATDTSHSTLVTVVSTESAEPASTSTATTNSNNLQTFTGALGGITAPPVVASGSQFQVEGNSIFNKESDALSRSCSVQQNACADAANKSGNKGSLTVGACGAQLGACKAASGS